HHVLKKHRREVTAALVEPPSSDRGALAELAHETGQPVVPVVIARDGDNTRGAIGLGWKCGDQRGARARSIAIAARPGVDQVTADGEDVTAGEFFIQAA